MPRAKVDPCLRKKADAFLKASDGYLQSGPLANEEWSARRQRYLDAGLEFAVIAAREFASPEVLQHHDEIVQAVLTRARAG